MVDDEDALSGHRLVVALEHRLRGAGAFHVRHRDGDLVVPLHFNVPHLLPVHTGRFEIICRKKWKKIETNLFPTAN